MQWTPIFVMVAGFLVGIFFYIPLGALIVGFSFGVIFAASRMFSGIMGRTSDDNEEAEMFRQIFRPRR